METKEINQEIERIASLFGMKAEAIAKAMNISTQAYRTKKSDKNTVDKFTEKNLQDLKDYIKFIAQQI